MPYADPEKRRAYHREYSKRHYQENKERYAERRREWLKAHPEKQREYSKRWREANPEKSREIKRTHMARLRAAEPERYKEHARNWRLCNPEKRREQRARRRARLRGAAVVEKIDRQAIYERDGGRCHICGRKVARATFTLDHLEPLARGGAHAALNLRVAHQSCNARMGVARLPAQLLLV